MIIFVGVRVVFSFVEKIIPPFSFFLVNKKGVFLFFPPWCRIDIEGFYSSVPGVLFLYILPRFHEIFHGIFVYLFVDIFLDHFLMFFLRFSCCFRRFACSATQPHHPPSRSTASPTNTRLSDVALASVFFRQKYLVPRVKTARPPHTLRWL